MSLATTARVKIAIASIVTLVPALSLGQSWPNEPVSVLGVKLGQPLEASGLPNCPERSYEATTPCLITASVRTREGKPIYSVGGHPFGYAAIAIKLNDEGIVTHLQAWMKHDRFAEFRQALTTRYGPPTSESDGTAQNLAGAILPSKTSNWAGRKVTIVAIERFEKMDESMVLFLDNETANREREQRENKAKDAASKL